MAKGKGEPKPPVGLIDPRYCCCAVPLVNVGIYSIILEQLVVGVAIGACAIGAPAVVAASFPSYAAYIFAITCFLVAICQPIGWIGALREKTSTFKVYAWANLAATFAAFVTSAVLIIVSGTGHDNAVIDCKADYYSATSNSTSPAFAAASNSTLSKEGEVICPPLIWAGMGIMAGLWVILLVCQTYFIYLTFLYSKSQVKDHKLYHSVYSENPEAFTMSILRSSRYNPGSVYNNMPLPTVHHDAWDARPSSESMRAGGSGLARGSGYYDDAADEVLQPPHGQGHGYQESYDAHGQYGHAYNDGSQAYPNHQDGYEPQHQGHGGQYSNENYGETPPSYGHADPSYGGPSASGGQTAYGAYGHHDQYGGDDNAHMAFPQAQAGAYGDQKRPAGPR